MNLKPTRYVVTGGEEAANLQTRPGRSFPRLIATLARMTPARFLGGKLASGPQAAAHQRERGADAERSVVWDPRRTNQRWI